MSVMILGGKAKGMNLAVPEGDYIRPTSVLLRRRVFDSFQDMSGKTFIDICSGTGAMGLEAASRGADYSFFIESDHKVISILQKNLESYLKRVKNNKTAFFIKTSTFESWIEHFHTEYRKWDEEKQKNTILFFDPPYEMRELYILFTKKILEGVTWFKGRSWIESDRQKGLTFSRWETYGDRVIKSFVQGTSYIVVIDS
ncbi:MAG: RsmD family RNA methyltransferase [Bacteriovoracaceae bacterium]|nr:RsmD family RNA methyltransferase [Bacteriovoracaceae bacterium]